MPDENDQGPDLAAEGIALSAIEDGKIARGHVGDETVILVRQGNEIRALGGTCTHYGGPLADGMFDGVCVRCPWHHGRFDVTTGAPVAPPLNPATTYAVETRGDRVYVTTPRSFEATPAPIADPPASVVIVGGGAAGNAAAESLRREGYTGPVTMLSMEDQVPYDRPNLSKDYLAGKAEPDWIPLHDRDFYRDHNIELLVGTATGIDTQARMLTLDDGRTVPYGALLLATGAEPVRLDLPGTDLPHVHVLRSLADSISIGNAATTGTSVVVIGASFIGLEVAAALRERNVEVHVVAPDQRPLEKVLGPAVGDWIRGIHESHGVQFHLGHKPTMIDASSVTLDDGTRIDGTLVVLGVGVRPRLELPRLAGVADERDVPVNEYLETRVPGIWAAGDIARWPDPWSGIIRVEHWVVAERQGAVAARNILGRRERYTEVPFFWSQHYDLSVNYVGHAEGPDEIEVTGSLEDTSAVIAYRKAGKTLAVATVWRDEESLRAELAIEQRDESALRALTTQ